MTNSSLERRGSPEKMGDPEKKGNPQKKGSPKKKGSPSKKSTAEKLPVIGWREWVALPGLGISHIKTKVDSGARSSSLNAIDVKKFLRDGQNWVRFKVNPVQRSSKTSVIVEAPVLEYRSVRSSSGKSTMRPVILTDVTMMGLTWPIEVTLAGRDNMGFRMLLGREAVRGRFLIDSKSSYFGGRPAKSKKLIPLTQEAASISSPL